jgi:hypothetical protein
MQGKILSDAVACGFPKPLRIPEFVLVLFNDFFRGWNKAYCIKN